MLARLGAEVFKIERLGGEETRYHAPWVRKQSTYWIQYDSGKKSLSMDLRKEEGKTVLRQLIKVRAGELVALGVRPLDALHVAFAERAVARWFVTCDDELLKLAGRLGDALRTLVVAPRALASESES